MSSREEQPGSWKADPETASASGGHLTPDIGRSPYDALTAPLPSELEDPERDRPTFEAPRERYETERSDVVPRGAVPTQPPRDPRVAPQPPRGRRFRPASRRVVRTIKHVDPFSVLKLSLFFYSCLLVLWLFFVAILYWIAGSMGLFEAIEEFSTQLVLGWDRITLMVVEKWAFLIGLTMLVIGSLANVFLAFLYNVGADLIGGVKLTFVERDPSA